MRRILPVLAVLAAGCNPFVEHYEGERFAPVEAARIVEQHKDKNPRHFTIADTRRTA